MKILTTEIFMTADYWEVIITNNNGLKVHIEGCETKAIAKQQAKDRIRELKKAGIIKS